MKEQYIKQVEKELSLTRKAKKEVVRDLNEVFASALEHGETEQQVIERLGTPKEFAENTAEQLGIDSAAPQKRKGIISSVAALVVAVAAFVIYATTQSGKVPDGTGSPSVYSFTGHTPASSMVLLSVCVLLGLSAADGVS